MSKGKSGPLWPYIKNLAKLVSVPADVMYPGTGVGMRFLLDLRDDLDKKGAEPKGGINEALNEIRDNTAAVVQHLAAEHVMVTGEQLHTAANDAAEALYLWQVAHDYVYADFKGIEQQERVASLKLDDIFVELKAVMEFAIDKKWKQHQRSLIILDGLDADAEDHVMQSIKSLRLDLFADIQVKGHPLASRASYQVDTSTPETSIHAFSPPKLGLEETESLKDTRAAPQSIDNILSRPGGVVLMGGPGSGKTTLVKRLARSCALGAEELKRRYPQLPWCFPVVMPLTMFQSERGECGIYPFLLHRLTELGGDILRDVFVERWAAGQCLVLLDGLDEVAETGSRTRAARAVDELLLSMAGNRVVVTTRVVGYNITRLSVPAEHHILEPFSPQEIATFVRQWYLAHDRALHPDHPNPKQAEKDATSLIDDMQKNPGVASLATNPLMLTIIALIKHANIVLPERRVELYEIAINTLLRSWNRARSLSRQATVGEEPKLEKTRKLWAAVAYWMHCNVSRTIPETKLHEQMVRILTEDFQEPPHQADDIASSYLASAKERSGLLEARGPTTFAFVHQTFQEYLAAVHLAIPSRKAVAKIRNHTNDPRWHEAIRLAAGYIAIHQADSETLGELMQALLHDNDPLEPYFATSLRLAGAIVGDSIDVSPADRESLILNVFNRLNSDIFGSLKNALIETARSIRVTPRAAACESLCRAVTASSHDVRFEAVRLLAEHASNSDTVCKTLHHAFESDSDIDVRALAAWGLWRLHLRRDSDILKAMANGVSVPYVSMHGVQDSELFHRLLSLFEEDPSRPGIRELLTELKPDHGMFLAVIDLLKHSNLQVRNLASEVLIRWDGNPECIQALLEILRDSDFEVSRHAVNVMNIWSRHNYALSTLLHLLNDEIPRIRCRAAYWLGLSWKRTESIPVLLEMLSENDEWIQLDAAFVLNLLEQTTKAIPPITRLLSSKNIRVRISAAQMLGTWAHYENAVPVLMESSRETDPENRFRAIRALIGLGRRDDTITRLLELVQDDDSETGVVAIEALIGWGIDVDAVPVLLDWLATNRLRSNRLTAIGLIARCRPPQTAIPSLLALLKHTDQTIRFAGWNLLQDWGPFPAIAPTLVEMLGNDDFGCRNQVYSLFDKWELQPAAVPVLNGLLESKDRATQLRAALALVRWKLFDDAIPVLLAALCDDNVGVRDFTISILATGCRTEVVVPVVIGKLFRKKADANLVIQFQLAALKGAPMSRSEDINQLLLKGIKPNARDSVERASLKRILYRWTWDSISAAS